MKPTPEKNLEYVQQSFNQFVEDLKIRFLFGPEALRQAIAQRQKSLNASGEKLSEEHIIAEVGRIFDNVAKDFTALLDRVQKALNQSMQPRYPSPTPQEQPGLQQQAAQAYKAPFWTDKMDLSNPTIRQAISQIANQNQNTPGAALTTAYNTLAAEMQNKLENEYKLRMRPRFEPKPAPKKKPGE